MDKNRICDGYVDCENREDEIGCGKLDNCHPPFIIKCPNENKCYSPSQICDDFPDCEKGTDEKYCQRKENKITKSAYHSRLSFSCTNNRHIPIYRYCDSVYECKDNSDEASCRMYFISFYLL